MFSAFAVDPTSLVTRFNEGLRLMKALWTEPQVTLDRRFWQLRGATMEPKPFQKPYPPIWFGANHPDAPARAVRHGDGFFGAGSTTTARFAEQVVLVREAIHAAGRDPSSFRIAKRVYIAVDDDAERARRRVAASLVDLYGDFGRSLEPVAITGSPDFCAQGMQEVVEAGAELILSPRSSTKTSRWNAWPPRSCPNCDDRAEDLDAGPPPAASSHRHSATRSMKGDEPPPHHLTTPLRT